VLSYILSKCDAVLFTQLWGVGATNSPPLPGRNGLIFLHDEEVSGLLVGGQGHVLGLAGQVHGLGLSLG